MDFTKKITIILVLLLYGNSTYSQDIQWAARVIDFSSELTSSQYSANQILEKPDVLPSAGESPSAWTPSRPNKKEFIKVGFDTPIKVRQIVVAESYSPSTVTKIFVYDIAGREYLINSFSASSIPLKGRLMSIVFNETSYKVAAVKLEFDGSVVSEYYSIDAIGISNSSKPTNVEVEVLDNLNTNLLAENLGKNVNSPYTEFKPLLSPNGRTLYFSRKNHPDNIGGEDIWYSEMDSLGEWKKAVNPGMPLNNESPNYISSITPDGNTVVLLLGNQYNTKGKKMKSGVSTSTKKGGEWSTPLSLKIENNYSYSKKANYFLSNDRQSLLLSVERDDTYGARDLYVSFLKKDNSWTEPKNLQGTINTAGDDNSPFLSPDNKTLYFSTNGLGGYGGNDIYVSRRLDDTWENWTEPQNLGADINSPKEDLFFNIPLTGNYAYYTQEVGEDNSDIFKVELPLKIMPADVVVIRGKLLNINTGKPIDEAKIIYYKMPGKTVVGVTKPEKGTGEYKIVLPKGFEYGYRVETENYLPATNKTNINLNKDDFDRNEEENFVLDISESFALIPSKVFNEEIIELADNNIPIADTFEENELKNKNTDKSNFTSIQFGFGKENLNASATSELNDLFKYLSENKSIKIEIRGYSDNTGQDSYNLALSERRAKSVLKYLKNKNIQSNRMKIKWFGPYNPIKSNETPEGRKANRRVEIEVK